MVENALNHLAIILDGNRRFAKRLMLEPWKGHEHGAGLVRKTMEWAKNLGIKMLTFYALSSENLTSRPKKELEMLFKIFRNEFDNMDIDEFREKGIRVRFLGDPSLLPKDLGDQCMNLEEQTKDNDKFTVNFAIAYGGRQELVSAVKKILEEGLSVGDIDEESFSEYLYMSDNPDMIIRTGGEKRLSNFLPWQSTYSELFFIDKYWPEFSEDDLKACVAEFNNRKRNYGK